jgi:hypothetical protein
MSFTYIKARLQCDGCGAPFNVEMGDVAEVPPAGWSLAQLIEDHMRGAIGPSCQGGHHLCAACTRTVDDAFEDDHEPTFDEVAKVLNEKAGV